MNLRTTRIRCEAAQLSLAFPDLRLAPDDGWLTIPGFRLPSGWQPHETSLLIEPPATYPDTAPDGFFLAARLRRRVGGVLQQPGHYFDSYKNPYAARGWHWYCLEDEERRWNARHDSLITFVEAIRTYLGTAD